MDSRAETAKSGIYLGTDERSVQSVMAERRVKPRIRQPFPTIVEDADINSQAFHVQHGIRNISSTSSVVGCVLRIEPGLDGLNGFAFAILQYEFV